MPLPFNIVAMIVEAIIFIYWYKKIDDRFPDCAMGHQLEASHACVHTHTSRARACTHTLMHNLSAKLTLTHTNTHTYINLY